MGYRTFLFKMINISPNFTKGARKKIGYIIHGTLGNFDGAVQWLCTPPEKRPVMSYSSAHYVVAKDGRVAQLIDDMDISWHAGNISNPTERAKSLLPMEGGKFLNPNESFIGIELEWFLGDKITEAQYKAVTDIIKKGGIVNPKIMCHKEVTDYKSDFQTADGRIDSSIVREISNRLGLVDFTSDTITPLRIKLNSQLDSKDFRGARDTTSYLFTELSKLK